MPDWLPLVRERLGRLDLPTRRESEIHAELADYLNDCWQHADAPGEPGSLLRREVPDWNQLTDEIRRAEEDPMNERTRSLWLPGLVTLGASAGILMAMERLGVRPMFWWIDTRMPVPFYVPWLVLLPVLGAIGAYWSKRVGGNGRVRLLAGSFPAAAMLALLVITFPLAFVIDWHVPALLKLWGLTIYLFGWVIVPGAALLLGALPFLRNSHRKLA